MSDSKKRFKALCKQIADCGSSRQVESFLEAILTPKERDEIPTRLEIIKMLKQGIPQREIAETLGVGIATITRGARELKQGRFGEI